MDHEEAHDKYHEQKIEQDTPESIRRELNFKSSMIIFLVLLVIFIVAVVAIAFFLIGQSKQLEMLDSQTKPPQPEVYSATTPGPFKELTIPYLASRQYESSMGELRQISSNANYNSYLTNYSSDGLNINGLLTQPAGQEPEGGFPAIVFVHGYIPPTTYQTNGESYSDYVDYLARNGFVVFKIDLRGHGESEGEPGGAYYSGDYVIDVLNARNALQKLNFVNDKKIGLWGHSMAGNVIFRSFVAAKDIPAIVIWGGAVYTYSDMRELGIDDNSYRPPEDDSERQKQRKALFDTYGEFDERSEFWKTVVPTNYLDGLTGAVQINHALNDEVVSIGYSRGLEEILKNANIKTELNEYSGGGHNITGSYFTQAMNETVRFFRENL